MFIYLSRALECQEAIRFGEGISQKNNQLTRSNQFVLLALAYSVSAWSFCRGFVLSDPKIMLSKISDTGYKTTKCN